MNSKLIVLAVLSVVVATTSAAPQPEEEKIKVEFVKLENLKGAKLSAFEAPRPDKEDFAVNGPTKLCLSDDAQCMAEKKTEQDKKVNQAMKEYLQAVAEWEAKSPKSVAKFAKDHPEIVAEEKAQRSQLGLSSDESYESSEEQ